MNEDFPESAWERLNRRHRAQCVVAALVTLIGGFPLAALVGHLWVLVVACGLAVAFLVDGWRGL